LPIKNGVGPVHLNRFRISMLANANDPGAVARIGRDLFSGMVQYMDSRTASVAVDSHTWNGDKTLCFRGVAMFKPFISLPVVVPTTAIPHFGQISIPIPATVRDLMIPDVHTDFVGPAFKGPTSFTAQTLKRQFETSDDATIRAVIKATVIPAIMAQIAAEGAPGLAAAPVQLWLGNNLADKIGDIAVNINQHHFLAGRRSFHFNQGSVFGYTDGRLVFETAAIERYSLTAYRLATDIAMGGAPAVIRPVWIQMVRRVALSNAMTIVVEKPQPGWMKDQEVHYIQEEMADISKVTSSAQWPTLSRLHPRIFDPQSPGEGGSWHRAGLLDRGA
jgi:hypothetical protein